jgi:hypothetical protein
MEPSSGGLRLIETLIPPAAVPPRGRDHSDLRCASRPCRGSEPTISEGISRIRYKAHEMPGKDQARGECDDHYRDAIGLPGTIGPAVISYGRY